MSGPIRNEEELRHWLATEDWYFSQHTRAWLERTPPDEAREMLAKIAADSAPEPRTVGNFLATLVIIAGLTPASAIAGGGRDDRKAGIRAALLLAHLVDARAVPALARVWEARASRQNTYHELIESALTRFVADPTHDAALTEYAETLRTLARRAWQPELPRRDLTPGTADLLTAILRHRKRADAPEDHSLFDEIIAAAVPGSRRRHIQEVARGPADPPLTGRP